MCFWKGHFTRRWLTLSSLTVLRDKVPILLLERDAVLWVYLQLSQRLLLRPFPSISMCRLFTCRDNDRVNDVIPQMDPPTASLQSLVGNGTSLNTCMWVHVFIHICGQNTNTFVCSFLKSWCFGDTRSPLTTAVTAAIYIHQSLDLFFLSSFWRPDRIYFFLLPCWFPAVTLSFV